MLSILDLQLLLLVLLTFLLKNREEVVGEVGVARVVGVVEELKVAEVVVDWVVGALSSPLLFPLLHAFTTDAGQKTCKIDKKINTKLSMKFLKYDRLFP